MCYEFYRPIMDLNKDLDILYSTCVFCGIQMYTMDALKHKCLKGYTVDDLISYGSLVGPEDAIDKFIRQQEREEPDNEDDTLLEYLDEDAELHATRTLKSCSSLTQKSPMTNYEAPYNYDGSEDGTCPISQLNYDKSQSVKNYESCNVYPHEKSGSLQSEDTTYAIAEPDKNEILSNFPGWTKEFVMKKYQNLKDTFMRRRTYIPSGSSCQPKRHWVFDESFAFLRDVLKPALTVSNVAFLERGQNILGASNDSEASENANLKLTELGFNNDGKVPTARKRRVDPVDAAILKGIENLGEKKRESRSEMSAWQKWGVWLGTEVGNVENEEDRLDLQTALTDCLRAFKKRRKSNMSGML